MKNNLAYIQISILNEVLMVYSTRDLADQMAAYMKKKDIELYVYETHEDGFMFRKKKDATISEDDLIKAFVYAIRELIKKWPKDSGGSIEDVINDNYDFKFDQKYIAESIGRNLLTIRYSGRIISLEIDL